MQREKNTHVVRILLTVVMIILLLPYVTHPIYNEVNWAFSTGRCHTVFEDYEWKTALWIKNHLPPNTLILSEPYTSNIISSLSGTYLYFSPRWRVLSEYYQEDLERIRSIKYNLFLSKDSEYAWSYAHIVRKKLSINYSLDKLYHLHKGTFIEDPVKKIPPNSIIILIITPRVSEWLKKDDFHFIRHYVVSSSSIDWCPALQKFNDRKYFELLKVIENSVYIYRVKELDEIRSSILSD
jgi:hypothetical protein